MRCVVVPDRFTNFQDFGGADFVVETLDNDGTVKDVLGLLEAY
jgi:hypothetical protein